MEQGVSSPQFDFSAGALCLDFANTLGDRPLCLKDSLGEWRDLVAFGEQAGLVSTREAAAARRAAQAHPKIADREFGEALALRECMFRVLSAVAAGRTPAEPDLSAFNAALSAALAHARVERVAGGFTWGWRSDEGPTLRRILWPVVKSAADLLVSAGHADLRECASATCSWLFLDRSPRRSRRWCSMKVCGNRDKVRRFYERRREGA